MPKTIFIDATWEKEIILGDDILNYFKKNKVKSIALFASVQFLKLDTVKEQLSDLHISVHTTKAKRTDVETQVLGCDAYHTSFKENIIGSSDAVLYIGDGLFHPKALLLSQIYEKKIRDVLIWDPVNNKMRIITTEDIKKQLQKMKANLKRFIAAECIGIIVTIKPGQQYFNWAGELRAKLEKQGKQAYVFVDDTVNLQQLENYPFIDAWVNTACPRIGTDDIVNIRVPMVNIREAFDPVKALEKLE